MNDKLSNEFKRNVYLKPDEYLNGWARKCGWKATLVYDSLWRHADKYRKCFPSIKLMAEEHGVSRDTIMRGLQTLIEYCLVRKEPMRGKSGKFLHNIYTLTDKTKWREPSRLQPCGDQVAKNPKTKSLTATHQVAHSYHKDIHIKDTHIRIYIDKFNLLFKKNFRVTSARKKKLKIRLKEFSFEEVLKALEILHANPFYRGKNDRGWVADPDFLIRSDEQLDKFLNKSVAEKKPKNIRTWKEPSPQEKQNKEEMAKLRKRVLK